jgi:thymidine phosphorylase
LGRAVGNALETHEAIDVLQGDGPADLVELTLQLGAEMLVLGDAAATHEEALAKLRAARANGSGLTALRRCAELQGGDPRAIDDPSRLPQAKERRELRAQRAGVLSAVATEAVGIAAMVLGAGRERVDDVIDPGVGLLIDVRLGDAVQPGDRLATLCFNDAGRADRAESIFRGALTWAEAAPPATPLIHEVLR